LNKNIRSIIDRAEELLNDLELEYNECLSSHNVSERAINITHEVLEKLRNGLDQSMRLFWEKFICPLLTDKEREKARVYFPITDKGLEAFHSILGQGKMKDLNTTHPRMYSFLLDLQPFRSTDNKWLFNLREIANKGEHINLIPQTRIEVINQINISDNNRNSISWNPSNVTFGSGVGVLNAPIDPNTQRIIPTPGITEQIEVWVSFILEDYGINALGFCKEVSKKIRKLINNMFKLF